MFRFPLFAALPALFVLVALGAPGCSNDDDGPTGPAPVYSSIVLTGVDTVLVGQTAAFTAVVLDTAGQVVASPQLTWRTTSAAIAAVNNAGVVTGQSEGDAAIWATGGGQTSAPLPLAVIQGRGWVDQSDAVSTLVTLRGVHFVNGRTGWIVGDQGTILRTVDAGGTWTPQASASTGYTLNAVGFATTSTGVVVGSAGRILRTTNAGATWAPLLGVDTDGGKGLNDVWFQDADRGWIVGNGGLILRTNNGGASWTRANAVTANDLESVSFPYWGAAGPPFDEPYSRGWIVGGGGTILSSDDFGQTWRIVTPFVTTDPLFGVARTSTADAIAVGSNNRVARTTASADTALWALAPGPTPFSNLAAVSWPSWPGLPVTPAFAAGKRTDLAQPVVLESTDGGQSWQAQDLPSSAPLLGNGIEDVFFLDGRRGWAVGTQGLVLHTATGGR
jgi:photosystem II stability/assembly factor-like uncharacterized protein